MDDLTTFESLFNDFVKRNAEQTKDKFGNVQTQRSGQDTDTQTESTDED